MAAAGAGRWLTQGLPALAACFVLVALDASQHGVEPPAPRAVIATAQAVLPPTRLILKDRGLLPMPDNTPAAHASSLLPMPPGHHCALMAFWFAGTRESAPDVQIASSCFERATRQWSDARFVVNRHVMGDVLGFGLRRMGNPVAWRDPQGKIHLFVVTTGLGGWAASRILHVRQSDDGSDFRHLEFAAPRILPLTWSWNLSHLVRGAPLNLEDGGMVLPAYFELGAKYPVALRFDAAGEFKGMTRMSQRRLILQPTLMALTATHWLALMRDNRIEGKIGVVQTDNGGKDWHDMQDLNLINPDASIFALTLAPWHFVLAHNTSPKSRQVLDVSESGNGVDWRPMDTLARGDKAGDGLDARSAEFSYPSMAWSDGSLWVSYTENRSHIAWQRFELEKLP